MTRPDLFIGITAWNSAPFLRRALRAFGETTQGVRTRIMVWDNCSIDESPQLAREHGAEVRVQACSQGDALNALVDASDAPYTLLAHADVVMLSPHWFQLCSASIHDRVALVSPEDIGCGPCTRPFGAGMPESSFMFWDTHKLRQSRATFWRRWNHIPYRRRAADFYGDHVTHRLPRRLADAGFTWEAMRVLVSPRDNQPIYAPAFEPAVWSPELAHLRYGLGNFYSLGGEITHYHNWYDRVAHAAPADPCATTGAGGAGFPLEYVHTYTHNFLRDYDAGRLVLPDALAPRRVPVAL